MSSEISIEADGRVACGRPVGHGTSRRRVPAVAFLRARVHPAGDGGGHPGAAVHAGAPDPDQPDDRGGRRGRRRLLPDAGSAHGAARPPHRRAGERADAGRARTREDARAAHDQGARVRPLDGQALGEGFRRDVGPPAHPGAVAHETARHGRDRIPFADRAGTRDTGASIGSSGAQGRDRHRHPRAAASARAGQRTTRTRCSASDAARSCWAKERTHEARSGGLGADGDGRPCSCGAAGRRADAGSEADVGHPSSRR